MNQSPLKSLHPESSLNQPKLAQFDKLTTEELIESLSPGQEGALKVKRDGTVVDGHHRIKDRRVDVDALPCELFDEEPLP